MLVTHLPRIMNKEIERSELELFFWFVVVVNCGGVRRWKIACFLRVKMRNEKQEEEEVNYLRVDFVFGGKFESSKLSSYSNEKDETSTEVEVKETS